MNQPKQRNLGFRIPAWPLLDVSAHAAVPSPFTEDLAVSRLQWTQLV